MTRPQLLDNNSNPDREGDNSHARALQILAEQEVPAEHPLAVATGFVNLGGLHHLAVAVAGERNVRLLIGAAPDPGLGAAEQSPRDRFEHHMQILGHQRDLSRFPPSRLAERLQGIDEWLAGNAVEVRRLSDRFLHGKAYLFGTAADARVSLVTSANLTDAGLRSNLELGLVDYNPDPSRAAIEWFDHLWADADDFKPTLRELLFPDLGLLEPELIYLRALLEIYAGEPDGGRPDDLVHAGLTDFQRDGFNRAREILDKHGGVIYADGVGTGKTEIGLALIEQYALRQGHYALVIAPLQLVAQWEQRIQEAQLPARVISYQDLIADAQLNPGTGRHRKLDVDKDAYRLVVIDEAHALRNRDTAWHSAVDRLMGSDPRNVGAKKHLALLTATPINNGLWDLYNLVMLFARHESAFAGDGIPDLRKLFLNAGASKTDPDELDPDRLFPLTNAVSVRRDRAFIERQYPDAQFADGTPVKFPKPHLNPARYDLDQAHEGLFDDFAQTIGSLTMARYAPNRYLTAEAKATDPDEAVSLAEAQLIGLQRSMLLKRFESCWWACKLTVERLIRSHDALIEAWDRHKMVLQTKTISAQIREESDAAGLAETVAEILDQDTAARPSSDFEPRFRDDLQLDRDRLAAISDQLALLRPEDDPKLRMLIDLIEKSPAQKIAVFATYADTITYLDENLPPEFAGRKREVVIGSKLSPEERTARLARFTPLSVIGEDHVPPDGEVDLLLATDVLSEGQNLQQAQSVISYDMPWNPQRVIQRNGRVIRLRSPHDDVYLTTMLPEEGELEKLLALEIRIKAKIKAASVFGMESEVIEGVNVAGGFTGDEADDELARFAARLADADDSLLSDTAEELSGAFIGEALRAFVDREIREQKAAKALALPWGVGASFRQAAGAVSTGAPGIFFATRTKQLDGSPEGHRYWRFVEFNESGEPSAERELVTSDLEMLRRINPGGAEQVTDPDDIKLQAAWELAAVSIVDEHNALADPRQMQQAIGPVQRWALGHLSNPSIELQNEEAADFAFRALSVARSTGVRHALGRVKDRHQERELSDSVAATQIVEVVRQYGLKPVEGAELTPPPEITIDDLGVVCWMAVLPAAPNEQSVVQETTRSRGAFLF